MKKKRSKGPWGLYLIILYACARVATVQAQTSERIQQQCMDWLAAFTRYAQSLYVDDGVNQRGDSIGHFREHNDDMAMVVAFVHEYGRETDTQLPQGISYDQLRRMATKALRREVGSDRPVSVWNLALTEEFLNFNLEKYDEQQTAHRVEQLFGAKGARLQVADYACGWAMLPMNSQSVQWRRQMEERSRQGSAATDYQSGLMEDQVKALVALCLLDNKRPDSQRLQPLNGRWRSVWQRVVSPMVLPDGECGLTARKYGELTAYAALATVMQDADALMLEQRLVHRLTRDKPVPAVRRGKHHAQEANTDETVRLATLLTTTWLLHDFYGDWASPPANWADFARRSMGVRRMDELQAIRSQTAERFAYLSWRGQQEPPTVGLGSEEPPTQWVAYRTGRDAYCLWATPGNALIAVGNVDDIDFYTTAVSPQPGAATMELDPCTVGKRKKKDRTRRMEAHVYFAGITEQRAKRLVATTFDMSRDGWTIILCDDTDGKRYLLAFDPDGTAPPFQMPKELRKEEAGIVRMVVSPE